MKKEMEKIARSTKPGEPTPVGKAYTTLVDQYYKQHGKGPIPILVLNGMWKKARQEPSSDCVSPKTKNVSLP